MSHRPAHRWLDKTQHEDAGFWESNVIHMSPRRMNVFFIFHASASTIELNGNGILRKNVALENL